MITELNYIINQQAIEYNEIKEENKNIELDIKNSIDLNNVRTVTKTKLGMQEPDNVSDYIYKYTKGMILQ